MQITLAQISLRSDADLAASSVKYYEFKWLKWRRAADWRSLCHFRRVLTRLSTKGEIGRAHV